MELGRNIVQLDDKAGERRDFVSCDLPLGPLISLFAKIALAYIVGWAMVSLLQSVIWPFWMRRSILDLDRKLFYNPPHK